ncbi:MAG: hypothetical protein ACQETD_02160 [Pseudomonadota bacterium]
MMPKIVALLPVLLLLVACQQTPVRDEDSSRSRLEIGTTVVLEEALSVPAGHARVFLQFGKVREKTRLKRYQPHCNFEVRSVSDGSLRIEPDSFTITERLEDEVEIVEGGAPRLVAAATLVATADSMPQLNRFVRYRLDSAHQPEVLYLTCHGGFDDPWAVQYPSLTQMREALGEWVSW